MKLFNSLAFAAALLVPGIVSAGSVVQYKVEKIGSGETVFKHITDGNPIGAAHRTDWVNQTLLFPNPDKEGAVLDILNAYTGEGFPIGFDFYYGGQTFNQFVPTPHGTLYFGYNGVEFNGQGGNAVGNVIDRRYMNHFMISMEPSIIGEGIREATVSYKTTGEAGDRVCTVQWDHVTLNDPVPYEDEKGVLHYSTYSLQIRLFEKDGRIEIAINEDDYCNQSLGFFTGLHGWDTEDQLILTAKDLDSRLYVKRSTFAALGWKNVEIGWSSDDDALDNPVYVFTPGNTEEEACTAGAPVDLKIVQDGDDFVISCKKNPDADESDGILIAYSYEPFTDADLPHNGVSYYALGNDEKYNTKIGKSTVIYSHNLATSCNAPGVQLGEQPYAEEASVTITGVPEQTPLYVRAYTYNGYPNYNTSDFAEAQLISTQLPPSDFNVVKDGANVEFNWTSPYPVIIARTTEHPFYGDYGYTGQFGRPTADMKAGDEIEGGGQIIYVGDASEFSMPVADLTVNCPTFFRIWNYDGDMVSATASDGFVVPDPTYPYEPGIENWPTGRIMYGWSWDSDNQNWGLFRPIYRENAEDFGVWTGAPEAINGKCQYVYLYTPALPATTEDMQLNFEYALETWLGMAPADPSNPDGPQLTRGNGPGVFCNVEDPDVIADEAGLFVTLGLPGEEKVIHKETKYNGTMREFSAGSYYENSSSFQNVTTTLPPYAEGTRVGIKLGVTSLSYISIRKFTISEGTGVENVTLGSDLEICGRVGDIELRSASDRTLDIYSVSGVRVASVDLRAGEISTVALPAGIYITDGVKVVVR